MVSEPENLERFATFAGHRAKAFDETDLISLGVGIIAGVALGRSVVSLGGGGFSLGMAGGPLFIGLSLGHLGHIGSVVGHLPRASRMLLMELGLVFFLADAGMEAGSTLLPVVQEYGLLLCFAALGVTVIPMILSAVLGSYVLRLNLLQLLGGVCGGMTSTPGLAALMARTDSEVPVVSYATAYPVALILIIIVTQVLVSVLG